MRLRISIVEDDRVARETLKELLEIKGHHQCIGTYEDAEEALKMVPLNPPDVLLMDIQLPGFSGIECAAQLRALLPDLLILMLTTYDDSERIFSALKAGANGYLLKRSKSAELLEAINNVYSGGAPMSASIARLVVTHFHQISKPSSEVEKLTSREREVVEALAKGLLYKEIADHLGVSLGTVNTHIKTIYRKLHVQTRTEAVLKLRNLESGY